VYIDPYDDAAHELLAAVYEKAAMKRESNREKRVLATLTEWRALQRQKETGDTPSPTTQSGTAPRPCSNKDSSRARRPCHIEKTMSYRAWRIFSAVSTAFFISCATAR